MSDLASCMHARNRALGRRPRAVPGGRSCLVELYIGYALYSAWCMLRMLMLRIRSLRPVIAIGWPNSTEQNACKTIYLTGKGTLSVRSPAWTRYQAGNTLAQRACAGRMFTNNYRRCCNMYILHGVHVYISTERRTV